MKIITHSIISLLILLAIGCQRESPFIDVDSSDIMLSCESGHYAFDAVSNCMLEVSSNEDWCSVSSSSELLGDTYKYHIELEYTSNDSFEQRVCGVSVIALNSSVTINVLQDPVYGIAAEEDELIVSCEEQDIQVKVLGNLPFVVLSDDCSWISCNETGSAPTLLTLHIQGNNGVEDRSGSIRLYNPERSFTETINVVQRQKDAIVLSKTEYSIGCDGEVISLEVGHNVAFNVSINVDWISEISTKSFSNEIVSFSVQSNPTYEKRVGQISFSSMDATIIQNVTVVQNQKDVLALDTTEISCGHEGGQIEIGLLTNVPVLIKDLPEWIHATLSENNSLIRIIIEKNESVLEAREAFVCCYNDESGLSSTLHITQDKRPFISSSDDSFYFGYHPRSIQIEIWHNIEYEVTIDVPWIVLSNDSHDGYNSYLVFDVKENTTPTIREGVITISNSEFNQQIPIKVAQYRKTEDLSNTGTSNSYIVSSSGGYSFRATRGNTNTVVNGSIARIVWETFGSSERPREGDVIKNVLFSDGEIMFETSEGNNNGNALVCLENSEGLIQWSWHIWVCDGFDPLASGQVYSLNRIMMDRNLGALSSKKGDPLSIGLLYQWGRKDPFLGAATISSNTESASTAEWPASTWSNSEHGTIDYAIHHPMTFIYDSPVSGGDWYYSGGQDIDMTRWGEKKTEYDPCPPGWKIPQGEGYYGVWNTFPSGTDGRQYWDDQNKGFEIPLPNGEMTWYPASGLRSHDSGALISVGKRASYWSYTCFAHYYVKALGLDSVNGVFNDGSNNPVFGCSVRCVRE